MRVSLNYSNFREYYPLLSSSDRALLRGVMMAAAPSSCTLFYYRLRKGFKLPDNVVAVIEKIFSNFVIVPDGEGYSLQLREENDEKSTKETSEPVPAPSDMCFKNGLFMKEAKGRLVICIPAEVLNFKMWMADEIDREIDGRVLRVERPAGFTYIWIDSRGANGFPVAYLAERAIRQLIAYMNAPRVEFNPDSETSTCN